MPKVVIAHAVDDIARWLRGHAERASALPNAMNVTDLVALDGSNLAAVTFDIDDVDAFNGLLSSMPPDMVARAVSHGVVLSTMTVYVET
jgi:hypothetical protein